MPSTASTSRSHRGEFLVVAGPSGLGQDDAAAAARRARPADERPLEFEGADLARIGDGELAALRLDDARLHLPAVQPDPDADRRAERRGRARAAAASGRRARRARRHELLERVGLGGARRTTCPRSSPAASSSAWRSRGRSPTARACCWPTSRPETSTRRRARRSSPCSRSSRPERPTVVLITHDAEIAAEAPRVIRMQDGRLLSAAADATEQEARS